jgi:hypothetical protein
MNCDTASIRINQSSDVVFNFMSDPQQLDLWSFGTWNIEIIDNDLILGKSIFDGSSIYVRVQAHKAQKLIDYHIGQTQDSLVARIFARVIPGADFSADQQTSMLLLTAIRSDDMNDERWVGLKNSHAFEVALIKSLIESGYDHRV